MMKRGFLRTPHVALLAVGLMTLIVAFPARAELTRFAYSGSVQKVGMATDPRDFLILGGSLSLPGSSTGSLPPTLTELRLNDPSTEDRYRDALERCSKFALLAQADPQGYELYVWLAVPSDHVTALGSTRLEVNLGGGGSLLCRLSSK